VKTPGGGLAVSVNLRMWCRKCQKSTLGKDCDCTHHPDTACEECGWCPSCQTDDAERAVACLYDDG